MAKAPAVTKQQATALVTNSFANDMEALKRQLTAPGSDKIRLKNREFLLPSGAKSNELDVVIVDFVFNNMYYDTNFQEGVVVSPLCFSLKEESTGMVPSANSPTKQANACDGCDWNEFGSKGDGKACQNRILIAVLPADADEATPLSILDISPASNKKKDPTGFNNYVSSVARALQRPPYGVITNLTFDTSVSFPKVKFDHPQAFDMENEEDAARVAMIRSRRAEARARLMTEPNLTAANDAPAPKKSSLKAPVRRRA